MANPRSAFDLSTCARPNILALQPYRCARDDYKDDGTNILLDANENACGPGLDLTDLPTNGDIDFLGLNRYPDPHQHDLKQLLCALRNTKTHTSKTLTPSNLFVGVGSDEAIDAILRCFCIPGTSSILTCPPTYGMYKVSACINDISIVSVPLLPENFSLDVPTILTTLSNRPEIKAIYLCSPGNPTSTLISKSEIEPILQHPTWNGTVVLDEAYIDFAPPGSSLAEWVLEHPNLIVLQTLSKAFGLAGIRLGVAFTSSPIAQLLNNLKAPYNISSPTSALAIRALQPSSLRVMRENLSKILQQRERLLSSLLQIPGVGRNRGGEHANFLLIEFLDLREGGKVSNLVALRVYERLAKDRGVVVRFRGKEQWCEGCLRITVGTEDEVTRFLKEVRSVLEELFGERDGSLNMYVIHRDVERKQDKANAVIG